ncbi:MAG: SMI1/KNR4 family protein [Deltaproteobacteria bacterium]|nr:SMI1/KNR4 family protein [Deltaproteobacteria bacterium]
MVKPMTFDVAFPNALAELVELEFDYADGEGIDFEPYQEFQSAEDNASWLQAWTGNKKLTGGEYRIFGQDGTGGYAAFWMVHPGKPVLEQPVVFFGSEGELGVVASHFGDFLWLLAAGLGPMEAVAYGAPEDDKANDAFTAFAMKHGEAHKKTAKDVLEAAQRAFPAFEGDIRALCR